MLRPTMLVNMDGNSGTTDTDGISYGKNEHKMGWNAQPAPLPLTMFGAEKPARR